MNTAADLPVAEHRDMTSEAYHAHEAVGASMLECFRESRRKFHAIYVAKTMTAPAPSPAMQLGTLVHLRLLEPERFAATVADPLPDVAPDGKKWLRREGSDHQKWWQEELDKRAGMIACDEETLDRVESIVSAIRANPRAAQLLAQDGTPEYSIFWTDPDTGIECKCRVDFYAKYPLDLKTSADPSPAAYAKSLVSLGYVRKLAHYRAGLAHLRGESVPFVHIAAETCEPYRVACYQIDDRDRSEASLGVAQRRRMLFQLAQCYASGDFREPWEGSVVTLQLPAYAFQEDAWQY